MVTIQPSHDPQHPPPSQSIWRPGADFPFSFGWRGAAAALLVFAGSAFAFWTLRPLSPAGGDAGEISIWIATRKPVYHYRAPLTVCAHRLAYRALRGAAWGPRDAMALNSALAGGLFMVALLAISRHPLFLLVNLACGAVLLFAGHEENYGWVNALLVVFLALARRAWDRRDDPAAFARWGGAATVAFVLACAAHMLAVFYLPALAALALRLRRETRRWRIQWFENAPVAAAFLLPLIGFLIFITVAPLAITAIGRVTGLDNNASRFVPLVSASAGGLTMFSLAHLKFLAWIHLTSAPLGLPLVLLLGWRQGRDPYAQWLVICALCGLGWTSLYNPDLRWRDWDLFANVAFPLNVLAGLLLARAANKWRSRRRQSELDSPRSESQALRHA